MNFDNVNTNVTIRKVGSTYGKTINNKNLIDVPVREKRDDGSKALQESMEKFKNANIKANKQKLNKISDQRFFATTLNEQSEKLKDELFCNILHQICVESMVIDEGPLYDNLENICNIIDDKYKEIGGFKAIKENAKRTNNLLLSKMIAICEETVKEVTDRNLKDKKDKKELSFDLSKDEKDNFDYKKGNIGIESIINNVKSKVIDVVKEEKKSNEEKSEMIEEIKTELGDAETAPTDMSDTSDNNPEPEQETSDDTETENIETEETDVDSSEGEDVNENTETENEKTKKQKKDDNKLSDEEITEALSFIFDDKIETTTLFESMMRKNYKALLENSKSIIFESCGDNEACASEDKKSKTKNKEYKLSELDVFDKDEEEFDNETDEDLMISETRHFAIENLSPEKIDELENYISEAVRIRTRPGNLGLPENFDTGVGDIIRAAQTDAHCVDSITLPGFKNKMIGLIKSCKNGADVTYVNQLAGLPFRLFKNGPGFTGYLESYKEWIETDYKQAYQEVIEDLNIKFEPIAEGLNIKGSLLGYRPVDSIFKENAPNVVWYMNEGDAQGLSETFDKMAGELETVIEGCKSSKKKANSCKESIRKLQKDTEEMEEESCCRKKAKEACNLKKACESDDEEKIKDELAEMLVCPDCGKDPCECEKDDVLNEYTINVDSNINRKSTNKEFNSRVDAHGSINYNKLAAAGLIAGAGGAVYGGYKLSQHKNKKLCQREVGINGKLEKWQKKIMKQIKKAKKAKDIIEIKIAIKNDMKALEKGKKKNPEYKVMIDNQIKWYKNVALKAIAEREKEFNISEDYEFITKNEDYLFEDYLAEIKLLEEDDYDDDEEDDDDYDDDDEDDDEDFDDDDEEDDDEECEEQYYFDVDECINELDSRKFIIETYLEETERPEGLEVVEDAINDDISQLVKTRNIIKNDPIYNEYVEKINNYIQWLQTSATNFIIQKKKEMDGDPMVESSEFDYVTEAKKIGKLQQKISKKVDQYNLASIAKRDWNKVQKRLEKKVKRCKTLDDVKYLESDLRSGDFVLKRTIDFIKNDPSGKYADRLKPLENYIKWGKTEYPALLKQRKKEIKAALKEQSEYNDLLDELHTDIIVTENKAIKKIGNIAGKIITEPIKKSNEFYEKNLDSITNSALKAYRKKINSIKTLEQLEKYKTRLKKDLKMSQKISKSGFTSYLTSDNAECQIKAIKIVLSEYIPKKEKELKKQGINESYDDNLMEGCKKESCKQEGCKEEGCKKESKCEEETKMKAKRFSNHTSKLSKKVYLSKINRIKNMDDLKTFKAGFTELKNQYKTALKQNDGDPVKIKDYLKWLDSTAKPAIIAKEKELKQKKVTESFLTKLDGLCDDLNEFVDTHEEARRVALESLYVNFNGEQVFAPILNEYDANKDNLYYAYKLKSVCESLCGIAKDAKDPIQMKQAERLIEYNMNQINNTLHSIEYNENTSYKCNILNEAYNYLRKLTNRTSIVMESLIIESDYIEPETITEAIEVVDDIINASRINLVTEQSNKEQMEVVMAEAIVDYTIMEAFNTLRLTNYKHEDVKKMVRENLCL